VPSIFISHSSRDDEEARAIRTRLSEVLAGEPYHYKVLLDEEGIRAGHLWETELNRWLAECGGAVLMLTEQALASEWVKKEAAILLWRQSLGSRVVIIPLLIGVTQAQVETAFPVAGIFKLEYLQVTDGEDADELIETIADEFRRVVDLEDQLGFWARRLNSAVSYLDDISRWEIARALESLRDAWSDTPDGVPLIVHALLHAESLWDVQTAVQPVLASFQNPKNFVQLVSPVGIPAEAAAGIMATCGRAPGDRVLVLTCTDPLTAVRYIRRASCVNTFYHAAYPPPPDDAVNAGRLFDSILGEVASVLGYDRTDPAGRLAFVRDAMSTEDRRGRIIQVLRSIGPDGNGLTPRVLLPLVERLRHDLPRLVILVLTRPSGQADPALGIEGAYVIAPAIANEEQENSYLKRLEKAAGP
jgi:hypothetical protein